MLTSPLVAVSTESQSSRTVFVIEAPAICAPTMNPLSHSHKSFPLAILTQNQYQLDLLSVSTQATEDGWMLITQLYHTVHLCGGISIQSASSLIYSCFSFYLSPFCKMLQPGGKLSIWHSVLAYSMTQCLFVSQTAVYVCLIVFRPLPNTLGTVSLTSLFIVCISFVLLQRSTVLYYIYFVYIL